MTPSRIRRRLVIRGHVQGVAFRASTVSEARRAGVTGWVRNLPDGRVEVVLEGAPAAVCEVERFCERGPDLARVEEVDAADEEPEGLPDFAVR
jgi:acylphosphatase